MSYTSKKKYNTQEEGEYSEKFVAHKHEKEVISMRISTNILKVVDEKANQIGISRNELINQMIQYALDNMADENE